MRVLAAEWASAGGSDSWPLLPEGYAMLRTTCSAFERLGHETTAIVSRRIGPASRHIGATRQVIIGGDVVKAVSDLSPKFDCVFLIAPETDGILSALTRAAEGKTRLLSCPSWEVDILSDKAKTLDLVGRIAKSIGIPEWTAVETEQRAVSSSVQEIGLPCVVKPAAGAGSQGLTIVRTPRDVAVETARLRSLDCQRAIVQELVRGKHFSAAFVARGGKLVPLSVSSQLVDPSQNFEYSGGLAPQPVAAQPMLWRDLSKIVEETNLQGLMGVDFVYDGDRVYFMEINPRMTTSCIGLSKIIEPGIAAALIDPPSRLPATTGYATWRILPLTATLRYSESLAERFLAHPEIVSPPFPRGEFYVKGSSRFLACTTGEDPTASIEEMNQLMERLREMRLPC